MNEGTTTYAQAQLEVRSLEALWKLPANGYFRQPDDPSVYDKYLPAGKSLILWKPAKT